MVVAENLASPTDESFGAIMKELCVNLGLYRFGWPSEVNFFRGGTKHFLRLSGETKKSG